MTGSTIYNTTDGPLLIDRAGRVLGSRERLEDVDVSASPVAGHLTAGRLVLIEQPTEAAEDVATEPADEEPTAARGKAARRTTTTQEA